MASWGYYGANIEINNIENSDEYGLIFNARVGVYIATMANTSTRCGEAKCAVAVGR